MTKDVQKIRETLVNILKEHIGPLKATSDTAEKFEVSGTLEVMQGKKKVEGHYFSTVIPKAKDCRFYFFPAYTHVDQIGTLPESLKKTLKGKSCFHVKYMDDELEGHFRDMVKKSISLYQADGLLAKS